MFMMRCFTLLTLLALPAFAQEKKGLEIDFLASYYDQDGEHSPVTGGIGTEELTSASPVVVIKYLTKSQWQLGATLGLDNITSASTDNMDIVDGVNISSASRMDARVFTTFSADKKFDENNWGASVGFSGEYDYRSINAGLRWNRDFNGNNTNLGVGLNHYADEIKLYNIDGILDGTDNRATTDLSLTWSQVLSSKTLASVELSVSDQSGWLSSPFQEVILDDGTHVAERLPDARQRDALRVSLNHAFSDRFVLRSYFRIYDDDWDVQAQTLELEPHFRWRSGGSTWLYPILRYHTQDGSGYFGLPGQFSAADAYYTADRDLSEFDSLKYGLGASFSLNGRSLRRMDYRLTYYDRDDGLSAINLSFGFGWSF